ncbi:MAG TPA: CHAT domain-containing tetratricopeptide repeat protein, partial [Pyrinomonadaceae bacterium]
MRKLSHARDLLTLAGGLLALTLAAAGHHPARAYASGGAQNAGAAQEERRADVRQLEPGAGLWRELTGKDEHHYRVVLAADQHVSFKIVRQGIILTAALSDPAGETLFVGNADAREHGDEVVTLVARTAGPHTLVIRPLFTHASPGRYRVEADVLRAANEQDRRRFAAQQVVAEADQLFNLGTNEARAEAVRKLSASLAAWRALGDRAATARTLHMVGVGHMWLKEFEPAHEHLGQALALRRAEGDATGEAETLRTIGMVYSSEVKNQEALKYFEQAAALQEASPERWQSAATLLELGKINWRLGQRDEVNGYFARAIRRLREVGDLTNEAGARASLSFLQLSEGEYQSALDNLTPALELFRTLGNPYMEAAASNTLGSIYYNLGEPQKALDYFKRSVALSAERKDLDYGASSLANLGITYGTLGDRQKALAHFDDALKRMQKSRNPRGESATRGHLGKLYRELGDWPKALEHSNETLRLTREQRDRAGEANALTTIGQIHASMGDHAKALEELGRALPIRRSVRDRQGEAATLYALAAVERDRGRLSEARAHIEAAIGIVESLRAKVAGVELRTSYLAAYQGYYELYVELLMRLHEQSPAAGHDAEALQAAERARARALLESLAEAKADIRQGVSPSLLERERSLARQLNEKERRRLRLFSVTPLPSEAEGADREVEALLDELRLVRAQIRVASPSYAALTQPQPLDLRRIREQLDDKTLLLVYSLGQERSFLFAVSPAAVKSYVLPKREVLEKDAGRVYELLKDDDVKATANTRGGVTITDRAGMTERRRLAQLLLGPVAGQLAGKRLVVVADGKLQYVPFAALPEPGGGRLLVAGHEVVNLPSLSVLEHLRRGVTGRAPAPMSVAVFADPIYSPRDERFEAAAARRRTRPAQKNPASRPPSQGGPAKPDRVETPAPADPLTSVNKAASESGLEDLSQRLYASGREADRITRLFPRATYAKILGFDASRRTLAQTDLSRYRILHFATHGLLNSRRPELSGLVLSLYDEEGRAQDGFLRAHEIYNLKLGADLVVLSACQT